MPILQGIYYFSLYDNISVSYSYYTDEQFNCGATINDTTFSIVHVNARRLKKNCAKVKDCLDALKCSFDIIAISTLGNIKQIQYQSMEWEIIMYKL